VINVGLRTAAYRRPRKYVAADHHQTRAQVGRGDLDFPGAAYKRREGRRMNPARVRQGRGGTPWVDAGRSVRIVNLDRVKGANTVLGTLVVEVPGVATSDQDPSIGKEISAVIDARVL